MATTRMKNTIPSRAHRWDLLMLVPQDRGMAAAAESPFRECPNDGARPDAPRTPPHVERIDTAIHIMVVVCRPPRCPSPGIRSGNDRGQIADVDFHGTACGPSHPRSAPLPMLSRNEDQHEHNHEQRKQPFQSCGRKRAAPPAPRLLEWRDSSAKPSNKQSRFVRITTRRGK